MVDINNYSTNVGNTTSDRTGEDITDEIEVDIDDVKLYKINELAPKSAPITIPYLEVYRTNELEYIPYISPYNTGIQSSDSTEDTSSEISATDTDSSNVSDTDENTNENNNEDDN